MICARMAKPLFIKLSAFLLADPNDVALFRIEDGHLTVLSIFHRKDLDAAVKRYG